MRTLVVCYSLTGHTRTLARALAKDLGADFEELRCNRYAPGFWTFLRAAYDNWKLRLPTLEPLQNPLSRYDKVVIAGPIWAFHPAAPIRAFLKQYRDRLPKVAFLLTHGGSAGPQSLREMEEMAGRSPVASLIVKEVDIKGQRFEPALAAFAIQLRGQEAA